MQAHNLPVVGKINNLKKIIKRRTAYIGVWTAIFLIGFWMRGDAKRLPGGRSHTHWAKGVLPPQPLVVANANGGFPGGRSFR